MSRLAVVLCCLLSLSARSSFAQTTALHFDSQPGDWVGQGQNRTWTSTDLHFSDEGSSPGGIRIFADNFSSTPSDDWIWWHLSFRAPIGSALLPGVYEDARRASFAPAGLPGLDVGGDGRGCNTIYGRFVIYEIEFDPGGQLTRFAADFEQHCEDGVPALFGAIRFNATRSTLNPFDGVYPVYALTVTPTPYGFVSGPGIDCGAGRSDCAETYQSDSSTALSATAVPGYVFLGWLGNDCAGAEVATVRVSRRRFCSALFDVAPGSGATPAPDYSQFYVYLDRQPVTGTRIKRVHSAPHSSISISSSSPNAISVSIRELDNSDIRVEFRPPFGELLAPGVYEYATGSASWEGGVAAISVSPCSSTGRFTIYDITYVGSTLTSFAADFEVHCDSSGGKIAGSVRYLSSRPSLLPFDGAYPVYSLEILPNIGGKVSAPGAIDCGDGGAVDCEQVYAFPTTVALEAVPSTGYTFVAWGGGCTGGGTSIAVNVDRAMRCMAVFSPLTGSGAVGDPANGFATLFVDAPGSTSAPTRSLWMWPDTEVDVSSSSSRNEINFSFRSSASRFAGLRLRSATGPVVPGDYDEAYGFSNGLFPTISVVDCSVIEGRFRVYEAVFDAAGVVLSFAADFEARCSSSSRPYVVGAVRFNSSRRSLVPFDGAYPVHRIKVIPAFNGSVTGPGIDCGPDGHNDCEESLAGGQVINLIATPSPGYRFVGWGGVCFGPQSTLVGIAGGVRRCYAVFNSEIPGIRPEDSRLAQASLFINGDAGSPAVDGGSGTRRIWTDVVISSSGFSRNRARLSINMANGRSASMEFRAPGTADLTAGTYENASSAFNTTGPKIDISGEIFRFCSPGPLVGRFVVHEVVFQSATSANLVSFAADFEYRCANTTPTMRGSIRMNSSRATVVPFSALLAPAYRPPDFSGDGSPDLVWRNSVTGRNAFWFMKGDAMGETPPFSAGADLVADLNWEIRAVGDMDGDRRGDVIWQHATNGKLAAWLFVGATRVATPLFITLTGSPTEPDLDWKIVGAADMNADGHTDVLWRHRVSGALRIWHMRGMEQLESVDLPLVVADQQWQVAGIADMNGDGWPDIVWRHYGNGRMAAWFMIDTFVVSTTVLPTLVSDTQWRLAGVADVNRDGHPDFVWQHLTGGRLAVWYMKGLNPVTYRSITPGVIADPNWRIVGVR